MTTSTPAEQKELPPTRDRVAVARAIKAGEVRHHPFRKPFSIWKRGVAEVTVTGRVAELKRANYAETHPHEVALVLLTDAGRAWLKAAERAT